MEQTLSEQELVRRENLQKIRDLGIDPYPAAGFPVNAYSQEIKQNFKQGDDTYQEVVLAGRLMSRRIMGKASFAELQDTQGRIQLYVSRDDICDGEDTTFYNQVFKKLLDVKTDADGTVHDSFTDPELRYRQRYVDLVVNPEVREVFRKRTQMYNTIRNFFNESGYLEVETPILQPLYGGAAARPFKTHHNTLDMTLYMRIANELYLKRLIVGGYDGVYEFSKDFRNEGMSRFHNPEFTQVEVYVAYKDYEWMMDMTEEMVERIAMEMHGTTEVQVGENVINFARPWKRFTMFEAIEHFTGIDISKKAQIKRRLSGAIRSNL